MELLHSRCGSAAPPLPRTLSVSPTGVRRAKRFASQFDEDRISSIAVTVAQAAGVYACVMASLLCVFVPQLCSDPVTGEERVCTLHDNFHGLTFLAR